MDNELILDVGQANEIQLACRRAGFTNGDIKRLCEGDVLAQLLPVIRGHAEVTQVTHVIDCDAAPLIPYDGWKVEEHKQGGQFTWDPSKLTIYLSDNQRGDQCIEGNKLRKELADRPVLNANVLDYLIRHPHLVPDEWKIDEQANTRYIYFWGTIYGDSDGRLCVRSLYFGSGRWSWGGYSLGYDWHAWHPAILLAS